MVVAVASGPAGTESCRGANPQPRRRRSHMAIRKHALGAALALVWLVPAAPAAGHRTPNFVVKAPTPELAREFGQLAEHYRRLKAIEWLGQEMPRWPEPCPLTVTVAMDGAR